MISRDFEKHVFDQNLIKFDKFLAWALTQKWQILTFWDMWKFVAKTTPSPCQGFLLDPPHCHCFPGPLAIGCFSVPLSCCGSPHPTLVLLPSPFACPHAFPSFVSSQSCDVFAFIHSSPLVSRPSPPPNLYTHSGQGVPSPSNPLSLPPPLP